MADRDPTWRAAIEPYIEQIGGLIRAMHALQVADGYLDPEAYPILADCFNLSRAEVRGVASFYDDFRDAPVPAHEVRVCRAEACQAVGGRALLDQARALGVGQGEFADTPVYCLGLCACGPAVMVDGQLYGRVTPARLAELLAALDG
jgi:formate dehydrogenase subunit gamma